MTEIETLEANLRFAEEENRKLKQGLWDEFFKAALTGRRCQRSHRPGQCSRHNGGKVRR